MWEIKDHINQENPAPAGNPWKPSYDAAAILQEQMEAAVALYTNNSLQTIADILSLNPSRCESY